MRLSNSYFFTLRENVKDEDSNSGNLLVKAGYVKKIGAGIYSYLPLGLKVSQNIQNIIREEMNAIDSQEVLMPALIPEEYYVSSGRRSGFGKSMFTLKDRFDKPYCLGPTHEELFALAAGMKIHSYKDMPFSLYQFETKYRDEPRPRYGLIRVREFIMKDAYTFDKDEAGMDEAYQKMFDAYKKAFDRMKMEYTIVRADTGIMGGLLSEEFQSISPIGEDTIVKCDCCDFSSNLEVAEVISEASTEEEKEKELVLTPETKSIEDVCNYLHKDTKDSVKALLMNVDEKLVIFFIRGDRELNETKALKLLQGAELNFANDELIAHSNAVPGFTGPIGLEGATVVVDREVLNMRNFVCGANQLNYHYINVNPRDFSFDYAGDIVNIKSGDVCPHCHKGHVYFEKGIEVGNTFKLGTKYSKAMNLQYSDENNKLQDVWMGSYGIGIGRCMAALAEQNYDEKGLIWPKEVAPYKVAVVCISIRDEAQLEAAVKIHDALNAAGIETLLDDRNERAGVKFNDMDLIGIPLRITVGKALADHKVEMKLRKESEAELVDLDDLQVKVNELLERA